MRPEVAALWLALVGIVIGGMIAQAVVPAGRTKNVVLSVCALLLVVGVVVAILGSAPPGSSVPNAAAPSSAPTSPVTSTSSTSTGTPDAAPSHDDSADRIRDGTVTILMIHAFVDSADGVELDGKNVFRLAPGNPTKSISFKATTLNADGKVPRNCTDSFEIINRDTGSQVMPESHGACGQTVNRSLPEGNYSLNFSAHALFTDYVAASARYNFKVLP